MRSCSVAAAGVPSRGCEGALLSCRSGHSVLFKQTFEDSFFSSMKLFVLNIVLKCS